MKDPDKFSRGMDLLEWDERRNKVKRFKFTEGQILCLGAGLLTAYALRQAGAENLEIIRDSNNKPFLKHNPHRIYFNISHSGSFAVCAVSKNYIGVDVEKLREIQWDVAHYCFNQDEINYLKNSCDQGHDFTRLWTRKESFLKMTGEGLSRDAKLFSVLPDEYLDGANFYECEISDHLICVCTNRLEKILFNEWRAF